MEITLLVKSGSGARISSIVNPRRLKPGETGLITGTPGTVSCVGILSY